jgi:imidazolonepropionase-like amidohydrolase
MRFALSIWPLAMLSIAVEAAQPTLIQCARLIDVERGRVLGETTLTVTDGRISAIRDGWDNADSGAIRLAEHTCMPGWIDLHTHLTSQSSRESYSEGFRMNPADFVLRGAANAAKTVRAGFTTVRDLGDVDNVTISLRNSIDAGQTVGPRIYTAATSLASTGGHADPTNGTNASLQGDPGPKDGVVNSIDDARKAVRQRYKEGADLIKITATGGVLSYAKFADNPQFTVEEVRAIVATANDYGMPVAAHAHGAEGIRRAVEGGVATIEHGTYVNDELVALMKKNGTVLVPTLMAGWWVGEKSKEDGYFPAIVRPKAARIGPLLIAAFARAHKAGVPWAFGTDTGVSPHGDNAREFELLVDAGVTPMEAIQGATINAAKVLREPALGVLAVGKHADVVAVAGNPIDDIKAVHQMRFVMKAGAVVRQD